VEFSDTLRSRSLNASSSWQHGASIEGGSKFDYPTPSSISIPRNKNINTNIDVSPIITMFAEEIKEKLSRLTPVILLSNNSRTNSKIIGKRKVAYKLPGINQSLKSPKLSQLANLRAPINTHVKDTRDLTDCARADQVQKHPSFSDHVSETSSVDSDPMSFNAPTDKILIASQSKGGGTGTSQSDD